LTREDGRIENKDYKAQRSILADGDAGSLSKEELFARGEELMEERVAGGAGAAKPGGSATPAAAPAPRVARPSE